MTNRGEPTRVVIMGAAGRDFHDFNMVYRADPQARVVAFTAAQIPDIAGRTYPPELSGPKYPDGIPIHDESELPELVEKYGDLRQLPGMPDPKDTQPAFLFKPAQDKSKLIPYDEQRALELMGKRGDLTSLYEEASDVTEVPADLVLRDHLVMKPKDMKDLMRWTQHDQG